MIILGIDPGTTRIGYGVLKKDNGLTLIDYGVIETKEQKQENRLLEIYAGIKKLIKKHNPDVAGIEKLYFSKNTKTALSVAEARGVIIFSIIESGIEIKEFDPKEIKSAITGYGNSDKEAVRRAVAMSLDLKEIKGLDDASDAIAIAIRTSFER